MKNIVIALAGNKSDLIKKLNVSKEEAQNFAHEIGATHFYISAKSGNGIEEML